MYKKTTRIFFFKIIRCMRYFYNLPDATFIKILYAAIPMQNLPTKLCKAFICKKNFFIYT